MKYRHHLLWIVVGLISLVVLFGVAAKWMLKDGTGRLFYVKRSYDSNDGNRYMLIEHNISDSRETVRKASPHELFLLRSPKDTIYYCQIANDSKAVIFNMADDGIMWETDLSDMSATGQFSHIDFLAFDGRCLYYSEDNNDVYRVSKQSHDGRIEQLLEIEVDTSTWIEHLTVSSGEAIAYVLVQKEIIHLGGNRYKAEYSYQIFLHYAGETQFIAEGNFPFWNADNKLLFVQNNHLMEYDPETKERTMVTTENGELIEIDEEDLFVAPNTIGKAEYLTYVKDTTSTPSMPQRPDIVIISLKDGAEYVCKKIDICDTGNMLTAFLHR